MNFTYGNKWKASLFAGYTKNLGTSDALADPKIAYGKGLDIDQLYMINPSISYNLAFWKFGMEYSLSTAYYGDTELNSGKVKDTHSVTNHRILALMVYMF